MSLSTSAAEIPFASAALHSLLFELIDYAGLFPPAGLGMTQAVNNFGNYYSGEQSWMLGRFVLPAARLQEFEAAHSAIEVVQKTRLASHRRADETSFDKLRAGSATTHPWKLSALLGAADVKANLQTISQFNQRNVGRALVDVVEYKVTAADDFAQVARTLPVEVLAYFEVALDSSPDFLSEIAGLGARAKIRTGGVVPEAIPEPEAIATFLLNCASVGLAFKATAGLHHLVRSTRPLTYAADAPIAKMHGFLNVFLAAMLARQGTAFETVVSALNEEHVVAFKFGAEDVEWKGKRLAAESMKAGRDQFAIAFGSCSFEEPIADLIAMGLL